MKIRNDYVSNSSSSSFIVADKNAAKMFYEDFKDSMNDYEPLGETMHVSVKYKDETTSWIFTDFDDFVHDLESGAKSFDDIERIHFECDDWDNQGIMYLNFLYLYFKKFGFNPDDSETEHAFRNNENKGFMVKIMQKLDILGKTEDESK